MPQPTAYPNPPYGVTVTKVLQNLTFHGYLAASSGTRIDMVTTQQDFTLQDVRALVQPDGTALYKYLLLMIGAGWCDPCNEEAQDLGLQGGDSGNIATWLGQGGLVVTVLEEGYDESTGAAPQAGDITTWLTAHDTQASLSLDLTQALETAGVMNTDFPANLVINLETMKIDNAWYGLDTTYSPWVTELAQ